MSDKKKAGRPKTESPKVMVSFRLSPVLVDRLKQESNKNAAIEAALNNYFSLK